VGNKPQETKRGSPQKKTTQKNVNPAKKVTTVTRGGGGFKEAGGTKKYQTKRPIKLSENGKKGIEMQEPGEGGDL